MSTDMILNCMYIGFGYVVKRRGDIGVQFCIKMLLLHHKNDVQ